LIDYSVVSEFTIKIVFFYTDWFSKCPCTA